MHGSVKFPIKNRHQRRAIKGCFMIQFNVPYKAKNTDKYLYEATISNQLSGNGYFTLKCQEMLLKLTGARKVLLTHSCTAALEMAYLIMNLQKDDEVIMPSYTFTSSANAVLMRQAIPVFVDINPKTLNVDVARIEGAITSKTRAICVVHYAGIACDLERVSEIANKHSLHVVEDAAQCISAKYLDRHLGTIGDFGAISFHDTKNLHCGQGGALIVRDEKYDSVSDVIWEKGTDRKAFIEGQVDKYTWQNIGSSFLMSELNASVLLAQLEEIEMITDRRLRIWSKYYDGLLPLQDSKLIKLQTLPQTATHNAHIFYFLTESKAIRDRLLRHLSEKGIKASFHYLPLHSSPFGAKQCKHIGPLEYTENASSQIIRLPIHLSLTDEDQNYVIDTIKKFFVSKNS